MWIQVVILKWVEHHDQQSGRENAKVNITCFETKQPVHFFQSYDFQVIIIYYCFTGFKQNFISEWQWISYIYQGCSNINTQMHMNTHPLNQKRSKSSSLITIIGWQVRKKIPDKRNRKFRQYVEVIIMMKIFLKTYTPSKKLH